MKMPLTDLQCLNAKPQLNKYKLADTNSLFLVVMPNGKRYWRYKYRIHGLEKTISFGQYPITSLAEAREKRLAAYKLIEKGFDPLLIKAEEKQMAAFKAANTFEPLALEWYERTRSEWTERHAISVLFRLQKYLFPRLGSFPLANITPQLLLSSLDLVAKTSPDTARRLQQFVSRIYKYAIATARADRDITVGLNEFLAKPKHGHVASIEIDELQSFLVALEKARYNVSRQTYLAMRLMLITFVRNKELRKAEKTEFNFSNRLWTIPGERMKKKLEHLVPLSPQAIVILQELFELNPHSKYLLPSVHNRDKTMSENTLLDFIYLAGYKTKMTVHGCRALATGIIQERLKFPYIVIDRQLAHVPESEVRRAYDRAKFLDDRITMMKQYADYIDSKSLNPPCERINNDRTHQSERNTPAATQPIATTKFGGSSQSFTIKFVNLGQTYQGWPVSETT